MEWKWVQMKKVSAKIGKKRKRGVSIEDRHADCSHMSESETQLWMKSG